MPLPPETPIWGVVMLKTLSIRKINAFVRADSRRYCSRCTRQYILSRRQVNVRVNVKP
jgi:hypothetical protein